MYDEFLQKIRQKVGEVDGMVDLEDYLNSILFYINLCDNNKKVVNRLKNGGEDVYGFLRDVAEPFMFKIIS